MTRTNGWIASVLALGFMALGLVALPPLATMATAQKPNAQKPNAQKPNAQQANAQQPNPQQIDMLAMGKAIFEKQWEAGKPAQLGGDGLGPVFNATSCVACHFQGGPGGGGPIDVNAEMLSLLPPPANSPLSREEYFALARATHNGFFSPDGKILPNIILHRFGVDQRYATLRMRLTGAAVPFKPDDAARSDLQFTLASLPVKPLSTVPNIRMVLAQRNTPAMFGLALIDEIPDGLLRNLAAVQAKQNPGISGRVAPVDHTKVGRFGWRGQIDHLKEFVMGACANELGLQVPGNAQLDDPLHPEYRPKALDLNQTECNALAVFCASLPPPKVVIPADPEKAKVATFGYTVFNRVGCGVCHVENVGKAEQVYSDFLLHDMGPKLADPISAQATLVMVSQNLATSTAILETPGEKKIDPRSAPPRKAYYGGESAAITGSVMDPDGTVSFFKPLNTKTALKSTFARLPTNVEQEWRTPPLWGVHDSPPYLHDGRAETLVEAIALHGGEAADCTARYFDLPAGEQLALIEYLHCLRAP